MQALLEGAPDRVGEQVRAQLPAALPSAPDADAARWRGSCATT